MEDGGTEQDNEKVVLKSPTIATISGSRYFLYETEAMNFFMFVIEITLHGDLGQFIAREVLDGREMPKITPGDLARSSPGPRTQYLRKMSQPFIEMMICRFVENFETYLSELIRDVLHAKPEILRSQESVKLEYLLQFGAMDDLLADLIDRKVNELGYLGFLELERWCNERMGIPLLENEELRGALVEFIETRNIIVHNRSKVNFKYLNRVRNSSFSEGDLRIVDVDYLFHLHEVLHSCVVSLDERIGNKFSLPMKPYNLPDTE